MATTASLETLNDDILSIIIAILPYRDAATLALVSRTVSFLPRRRILSSIRLEAPGACSRFHRFMLEEDNGFRLQCLRRLTIHYDSADGPQDVSEADSYSRLASVLEGAGGLRELCVTSVEKHLSSQNGDILGNAIALLSDLQELELHGIGEEGAALCARLTCRPEVVCLGAVDSLKGSTLPDLSVLLGASMITLYGSKYLAYWEADEPLPLPPVTTQWLNAHTLRLRNMDPMPRVAFCPNLIYLHVSFESMLIDGKEHFPSDEDNAYSTIAALTPCVTARPCVLDIYVDHIVSFLSNVSRTIITTVRLTYPVVLSLSLNGADINMWKPLALLSKRPDSRLRYLDVMLNDSSVLVQHWLDVCLPLLADCGLLCLRLKFIENANDVLGLLRGSPAWKALEGNSDDWFANSSWKSMRDAASTLLVKCNPRSALCFRVVWVCGRIPYRTRQQGFRLADTVVARCLSRLGDSFWLGGRY